MVWQVLADEFSWQAWKHEGAARVLPPKGILNTWRWKSLLNAPPAGDVEFLLIESAWENFKRREDVYAVSIELAEAYRRAGVPVVFWNKEDPVCFDDFINIARACDVVLTTDRDMVGRYREAGVTGPVDVMTFAAQPQLHRQYAEKDPQKILFFAGTLRAHHSDRMRGFDTLVRPALGEGLHIFSRKGRWPEDCQRHVVGSYPYLKLLKAYSPYQIGLNISSVRHSPTMFPRRVVEMPLANIFVVSDNCQGVAEMFPEIPCSDTAERTREILQYYINHDSDRLQTLEAVKSRILNHHTCSDRLRQIRSLIDDARASS